MSDAIPLPERCGCLLDGNDAICPKEASLVCIWHTADGPMVVAACKTHLMRISAVIDRLVQCEIEK